MDNFNHLVGLPNVKIMSAKYEDWNVGPLSSG